MSLTYRQGDVLLIKRDEECPESADGNLTTYIVAEGEITGHSHRLVAERIGLRFNARGGQVIDLPMGGRLLHEEHKIHVLQPGSYDVKLQKTVSFANPESWMPVRD
jgi:hypothetical protein